MIVTFLLYPRLQIHVVDPVIDTADEFPLNDRRLRRNQPYRAPGAG